MDKEHENKNEAEAVVEEVVETEVAEAVEETTDVETEAASEAEAAEEAAEEETEPEDTAAEEPETETAEPKAEDADPAETQIITEEVKAALEETAEEEIADAKIQAGINEAAEEFKVEQELANTGDEIAGKIEEKPYRQAAAAAAAEPVRNNRNYTMEGNKKMDEKIREEAQEVKTVYIKEKKRTGWWKIVMLILTILITLTFGATALFAGLGTWQLYRIAENQEKIEIPAQNVPNPYYYGGGQSGNGGYYDDSYGSNGQEDYSFDDILDQYGIDEDFDWNDIEQYFGNGGNNGGNNNGSNNGGNSGNSSDSSWRDDVSDWFTSLFGNEESSGSTQGF